MENPNPEVGSGIWPWSTFFVFLLMTVILGGMLGSLLVYLLTTSIGMDTAGLLEALKTEPSVFNRNLVRATSMISHVMSFAVPGIIVAYFFYRKSWIKALKLDQAPKLNDVLWGTLLILAAFPLSQFALWLNKQLPLPEWARQMEDSVGSLIKNLLVMESPGELAFSLLVIAIAPAIGEELVYRGLLQQKLEERLRPNIAIWVAAFIFSAFHLQLEGLLPRMFLGGILGYLLYWTQNLWVPIIAHFFLNGLQVLIPFFMADSLEQFNVTEAQEMNWGATLFSAVLTAGIIYLFVAKKQSQKNTDGLQKE